MTDDRPARSPARTVAGAVVLAILLNMLLRVVPLPAIDLPSVALPGWAQAMLTLKHTLLMGFVLLIVIGKSRGQRA
jgi:hypothetical protein